MITWHDELPFDFSDPAVSRVFTGTSLFFDIETTGLSPASTSLYLIGCAARRKDLLILDQFFAETPAEEAAIMDAFFALLAQYDTVITFNGDRFDIPYLRAKCGAHGLADPFAGLQSVDIRQRASRIKSLLNLSGLSQKSVGDFLGLARQDTCTGGELIFVYEEYTQTRSADALSLLKLHNYEDVLHMPALLPVLSFCALPDGAFHVVSVSGNEYPAMDGSTGHRELFIRLQLKEPLPARISCNYREFYLTACRDTACLRIGLFEGELKFFFPDYADYFYLPEEDTAIHKSVSSYVDKDHREKATAATCYTKKYAIFLPQYEKVTEPFFLENYRDKKSYFELTCDFTESETLLKRYLLHVLRLLAGPHR